MYVRCTPTARDVLLLPHAGLSSCWPDNAMLPGAPCLPIPFKSFNHVLCLFLEDYIRLAYNDGGVTTGYIAGPTSGRCKKRTAAGAAAGVPIDASASGSASAPKTGKQRKASTCKACGQPKKGHTCTGSRAVV